MHLFSMSQSIINQFFAHWQDHIGSFFGSALFFYFAFGASALPLASQKYLPSFIQSKKFCLTGGVLLACLGLYGSVMNFNQASPGASATLVAKADWKEINRSNAGDSISIDMSTISRKEGLVEYWSKVSFKLPRSVGPSLTASHFIDRYVANCAARTFSHRFWYALSQEGQLRNSGLIAAAEQAFLPFPENGTNPDAIALRYVCPT